MLNFLMINWVLLVKTADTARHHDALTVCLRSQAIKHSVYLVNKVMLNTVRNNIFPAHSEMTRRRHTFTGWWITFRNQKQLSAMAHHVGIRK